MVYNSYSYEKSISGRGVLCHRQLSLSLEDVDKEDVEDTKVDHGDIFDPRYWDTLSPDKSKVLAANGPIKEVY
ncbi:hypothetical protein Tco_1052241 [Tanacetum coccineum]